MTDLHSLGINATEIDSILRGQVGVVLGLLLSLVVFGVAFHFVVNRLIKVAAQQILDKLDAMIQSNLAVIEATDRQTRVVGNLLMETAISDVMRQRGAAAISEVNEAEARRKK